jgi:hypothetical protein
MDSFMITGILMIVAIFVTPVLVMVAFFLFLEQRDHIDYIWELQEKVRELREAEVLAFSDGYHAGRHDGRLGVTRSA